LTTAASVWAVAALGLAAGGGLYFAATISTVIILIILAGVKPIEDAYRTRVQSCTLDVVAERDALETVELKKVLGVRAVQIRRVVINNNADGETQKLRIQLVRMSRNEIRLGLDRLRRAPGIMEVDVLERKRGAPTLAAQT